MSLATPEYDRLVAQGLVRTQQRTEQIHRFLMPTRVHDTQARKIQPQRQCLEPIRDFLLPRRSFDYVQKPLMLLPIPLLVMVPQELSRMVRVWSHPRNGIEFMIAQNGPSRPR